MEGKKKTCACVADDAQVCFRLRYPEPEDADWNINERCMCPCHAENQVDYDDEYEDRTTG